ncbi:MAG: hypothetical protein J1F11_08805 [Oscillospiraceae bacterium]|nr:hypothetical protein [Oscillospiraceae bacterium]
MKIHYFQRYHSKENVATANTMLLLSRFYQYSTKDFFQFLKIKFFNESFEPEIFFNLQEKNIDSVPDATITQESFKIVVETKRNAKDFSFDQLMNHLKSFSDEKYKVLITLAPTFMTKNKKDEFENQLKKYNVEQAQPVIHVNTTFEEIATAIQDVIDERDFEMQEVLDDYFDYCINDNLIVGSNYMRVQLANTTFDFNVRENVYYDNINRPFRAHSYLGLYKGKSVRAIGKINAIITAVKTDYGLEYNEELGDINDERKAQINKAIEDAKQYGYKLVSERYFFVEKFYETDFKKVTPNPPMGSRKFDLTQVLDVKKLPDTEKIAELLKTKTWV